MFFLDSEFGLKILTIVLSAITAAIAISNWRAGQFRAKLKDDLEILRRYRDEFGEQSVKDASLEGDKRYLCLRDKVQGRMKKAYVMRRTDVSDVISAAAFFLSAIVAWLLTAKWISAWRPAVIGVLISAGVAFLYSAFKDRGQERI